MKIRTSVLLPILMFFFLQGNGQDKIVSDTVKVKFLVSNHLNQLQVIDGFIITVKEWREQYEVRQGDAILIMDADYYEIRSRKVRKDYTPLPTNLKIWQIKT